MARSDLLISLVKAGSIGDKASARAATEAIIAEERAKRHNVLAARLAEAMSANGDNSRLPGFVGQNSQRHREFLMELTPRRRLEDLILSDLNRQACGGIDRGAASRAGIAGSFTGTTASRSARGAAR